MCVSSKTLINSPAEHSSYRPPSYHPNKYDALGDERNPLLIETPTTDGLLERMLTIKDEIVTRVPPFPMCIFYQVTCVLSFVLLFFTAHLFPFILICIFLYLIDTNLTFHWSMLPTSLRVLYTWPPLKYIPNSVLNESQQTIPHLAEPLQWNV